MPAKRATLAKLTRPRLYAPIKRTRLFKLLDRRKQTPIVWVSGPPGSGKTTLVASYLETRSVPTYWFQVDEGDRDPATFFHYLAELAKQSKNHKRTPLPILLADYLPDLAGFTRRYFRELFARLRDDAVLVLDNCQDAAGETFHQILREACQQIPSNGQIIVLSRVMPPAELSREITNGRLQLLTWSELRLSDIEALAIANASASFTADHAAMLNRQCDGWVGGLVLLLAHGQQGAHNEQTRGFESKEALFNYFAEEVFARAGAATRKLLLCTALFPNTTVAMALSLTGDEAAGEILSSLYNKQYFIERKVEGELTYQYHDLFREFLLRRLDKKENPAQLVALRQRAATILEDTGRLSEAVDLFKQAQDWLSVAQLIRAHSETLLRQGRWQTLTTWFDALPKHILEDDPWLVLWHACAQIPLDLTAAYETVRRAYRAFAATQNEVGQFYALFNATGLAYMLGVSFAVFDEWLPKLEEQLARSTKFPTVEVGAQAWVAYLAMVYIRAGKGHLVERGERWLVERFATNELGQGLNLAIGDQLLHRTIWPVPLNSGLSVYTKLKGLVEPDDSPPDQRYAALKDLGYWHYFNAEYAQSLVFFDRANKLATQFGMHAQRIYTLCYRAMALCGLGDVEGATITLQEIDSNAHGDDVFSSSAVNWASSVLEGARGHYAAALNQAQEASVQAHVAGLTLLEIVTKMTAAVYAVELNRCDDAMAMVRHIRDLTQDTVWRFPPCLLNAIEVEAHLRRDNKSMALSNLRETLRLAHNPRMAAFLAWAKQWLPRHFALALKENIEADLVKQLIHRFKLAPDDVVDETWPWPIKLRAFIDLEIYLQGERYASTSKSHYRVLQLLKVIIALGGHQVPIAVAAEHLWPDADGDVAISNLRTALHRLRKLLGRDDAILVQDNKISINRRVCWLDTWAFDAASSVHHQSKAALPKQETACRLYRGHLLAQDTQAWALPLRERLRARYRRCVLALAAAYEQCAQWDTAEAVLHQCLERDPSAEAIYRQLMVHLKNRGRHTEALDVYRRCEQTLHSMLAVRPSPETKAVYDGLRVV